MIPLKKKSGERLLHSQLESNGFAQILEVIFYLSPWFKKNQII